MPSSDNKGLTEATQFIISDKTKGNPIQNPTGIMGISNDTLNYIALFLYIKDGINFALINSNMYKTERIRFLRHILAAKIQGHKIPRLFLNRRYNIDKIQVLSLSEPMQADVSLVHISKLKELRQLTLSGLTSITNTDLSNLNQLEKLSRLDLSNCVGITSDVLYNPFIRNITHLNLSGCTGIREISLVHISAPRIKQLNLSRMDLITPLNALSHLSGLEELDLSRTTVNNSDIISNIKNFSDLRVFKLNGPSLLNDNFLEEIAKLTKLSAFFIESEFITKKGLLKFLFYRKNTLTTLKVCILRKIRVYLGNEIKKLYEQLRNECFGEIKNVINDMPGELINQFMLEYMNDQKACSRQLVSNKRKRVGGADLKSNKHHKASM